jgi:hypothetical protein
MMVTEKWIRIGGWAAILGEMIALAPDLAERVVEIPLVLIGLLWVGLVWQMASIPNRVAT